MENFVNPTILEWQRSINLDDKLLYKDASSKQECFVRDKIGWLSKTPIFVVGAHYSKSCTLPVYYVKLQNGIEIWMRCNFYNWKISIKSLFPITIDDSIVFESDGFYEGMKKDWQFGHYKEGCHECSVMTSSDYNVYTTIYLLNKLQNPNGEIYHHNENIPSETEINQRIASIVKRHPNLGSSLYDYFRKTYFELTDYDKKEKLYGMTSFMDSDDCETFAHYISLHPYLWELFEKEAYFFENGESTSNNFPDDFTLDDL